MFNEKKIQLKKSNKKFQWPSKNRVAKKLHKKKFHSSWRSFFAPLGGKSTRVWHSHVRESTLSHLPLHQATPLSYVKAKKLQNDAHSDRKVINFFRVFWGIETVEYGRKAVAHFDRRPQIHIPSIEKIPRKHQHSFKHSPFSTNWKVGQKRNNKTRHTHIRTKTDRPSFWPLSWSSNKILPHSSKSMRKLHIHTYIRPEGYIRAI